MQSNFYGIRLHFALLCFAMLAAACDSGKPEPDEHPVPAMEVSTGENTGDPSIQRKVVKIIAEILEHQPSSVPLNKPIMAAPLRGDDLDLVEIVLELEEQFGIKIGDAEYSKSTTPADLVKLVQRHNRSR